MDLTLSDEQRLLRDSAEQFVGKTYTADYHRQMASEPLGFRTDTWRQFADLGWLALPIEERYGGMGGGAVEIGILMEAFGRGLAPEPYVATVILGAALIAARGSEAQKQELLPRVAGGTLRLAFAHNERAARSDLAHVDTTARPTADGWRIDGDKIAVLDATAADRLIVSARLATADGGKPGPLGLFLVARDTAGVALDDFARLGGGRACNINLHDVRIAGDARLGDDADALSAIEAVIDRALAALGAEAVGMMQVLLDKTLEYTKIRKQFGRPLGANQVVRHRLTDMSIQCDEARSMALRAALHADSEPGARALAASGAKAKIGKCARFVAEQSVQLHGAMGVTEELEIGLYFKRLLAFETMFGSTSHHYRRHATLSVAARS